MSSVADFDLKERVRSAVDILDVISATLEVQPQGRNFVARCPWHDDRRPSMTINQERQTWKCWPCDIGGDVFSFIMRRDGVDFPAALRSLAEQAGIPIEQYRRGKKTEFGAPDDRETLLAAMKLITDAYYNELESGTTDDAKIARDYLTERGFTEESRKKFRIGFAPDSWSYAIDLLAKNKFSGQVAHAAGIASPKRASSGFVDFFRGRLMFPIHDMQSRPIALGGRIIPDIAARYDDGGGAKYYNGRETMLFRKSHQLYGLELAREPIRRSGEALVMEGYTDVVAAAQSGVEPVVAVLGTALGQDHVKILKRFAQRVVLVLDGDDVGQRRADDVLELFIGADVDLRVLTLPDAMDPADYIASQGREAFEQLVKDAPDALDHKLAKLTAGIDVVQDTHAVTTATETMLGILAKAPTSAGLRIDQMLIRMAQTFQLRAERLEQRLDFLRSEGKKRQSPPRQAPRRNPTQSPQPARPKLVDPNDAFAESAAPPDAFFDAHGSSESEFAGDFGAGQLEPQGPGPLATITGIDRELFETLIENPDLAGMAVETIDPNWLETITAKMVLSAYQDLDLDGHPLDANSLLLLIENEELKNIVVTLQQRSEERAEHLTQSCDERFSAIMSRYREREFSIEKSRQIEQLKSASLAEEEEDAMLQAMFEQEKQRHQSKNQ